jgi:ParB family chromosome partitioning protein
MGKRSALGKGIGALLEDAETVTPRERKERTQEATEWSGVSKIEIERIEPNPDQPRKRFDEEALQELADSIASLGVLQPITVRDIGRGKYQILSGERRYRAVRMAGLETIPAYVRSTDDDEVLIVALTENIQREDLDALEIALCYQRLMDECNLTQARLSERVGKKRATVANYLRLLEQPAEVQAAIRERQITMGHARAIAGLPDHKSQIKTVRKTVDEGLSVRQVEALVKKLQQPPAGKKPVPDLPLPNHYQQLMEVLEQRFNSHIAIKRNEKGRGSITIPFANDDEVKEFLTRLK